MAAQQLMKSCNCSKETVSDEFPNSCPWKSKLLENLASIWATVSRPDWLFVWNFPINRVLRRFRGIWAWSRTLMLFHRCLVIFKGWASIGGVTRSQKLWTRKRSSSCWRRQQNRSRRSESGKLKCWFLKDFTKPLKSMEVSVSGVKIK